MLYHSIFSAAALLAGLANAAPAAHPQHSTLVRRQVLPTWPSDGSWVPDNTGAWVPEDEVSQNIAETLTETEYIPAPTDTESSGTHIPASPRSGKTVAYFGQAGSSETDNLAEYCENTAIDVVVLGF